MSELLQSTPAPRATPAAEPAALLKPAWGVPRLFEPTSITRLVYFRIAFGLYMAWQAGLHLWNKSYLYHWVWPKFHFTYYGFDWVRPLSAGWMQALFVALFALSCLMAVGLFYRASTVLYLIGATYVFLLDRTNYNNHFYLFLLVAATLAIVPAHRALSLDRLFGLTQYAATVPAWMLWLVGFHVALPYFFGGVAKINADWLHGEPMRTILAEAPFPPAVAPWLRREFAVYLLSYCGLLFDLLLVPCLLWRPTRIPMFIAITAFHLCNSWLFPIGIFPWFMIGVTYVLFFPRLPTLGGRLPGPVDPTRGRAASSAAVASAAARGLTTGQKTIAALLGAYVLVQCLLPLRHWLYPGDAGWRDEGHSFAWRMMLYDKKIVLQKFIAHEPRTGRTWELNLYDMNSPDKINMSPEQIKIMLNSPDLILQFCQMFAADRGARLLSPVEVHVIVVAKFNAREEQLMIDPTVNLVQEPRHWLAPNLFVIPLGEPRDKQDALLQRLKTYLAGER